MTPLRPRILIVDDDPDTIDRLRQVLEDHYEVISTSDWSAVSRLFYKQPCDLVLMDVNLPGLSGDQLVSILKRVPASRDSRARLVYFTSADEDRARALTAATGADGYILKSARTATILSQIEGFLDL